MKSVDMSLRVVTIDIETSLREPWTETGPDGKPTFAPLPLHQPEIVCWLVADAGELEIQTWDRAETSEQIGMGRIGLALHAANRCVGWNSRGFDLPLLSLRAMAVGADWSWYESRRHRYPNYRQPLWHYDIMDQLSDYGAARGLSLDRVAGLLGLGKQGMHGGDVFGELAAGRRAEVRDYCANDCLITYLVYLAWSASHGGATGARAAYQATLEWAAQHPILSRFYGESAA